MDNNPKLSLEELIHRELSRLPERPAPATLVPKVLAQIQARAQKHWWQRPWTQWPAGVQMASLPLMFASVAASVFGFMMLWRLLIAKAALVTVADKLEEVSAFWDLLSVLGNAAGLLAHSVGQQWLLLAVLVPLMMYAACVGLGTLCYRMALSKR